MGGGQQPRKALLLLWDRVMRAALDWFARPPSFHGAWSPAEARSAVAAEHALSAGQPFGMQLAA